MSFNDAFALGQLHYSLGVACDANPFDADEPGFVAWLAGWGDAHVNTHIRG